MNSSRSEKRVQGTQEPNVTLAFILGFVLCPLDTPFLSDRNLFCHTQGLAP